jgi:serine phosphatase RsbU (regulator of sigma subunit)
MQPQKQRIELGSDLLAAYERRAAIEPVGGRAAGSVGRLMRKNLEKFLRALRKVEVESALLLRELEIAREVQMASFPQHPPDVPGLNCAIFYKPALSIGGDYYDFLPLPNGTWGIAVGDVSGKGIGAALMAQTLRQSSTT